MDLKTWKNRPELCSCEMRFHLRQMRRIPCNFAYVSHQRLLFSVDARWNWIFLFVLLAIVQLLNAELLIECLTGVLSSWKSFTREVTMYSLNISGFHYFKFFSLAIEYSILNWVLKSDTRVIDAWPVYWISDGRAAVMNIAPSIHG